MQLLDRSLVGICRSSCALALHRQSKHSLLEIGLGASHLMHRFAQLPAPVSNLVLETGELVGALCEVLSNHLEQLVVLGIVYAKLGLYFGHVHLLVKDGGLVY